MKVLHVCLANFYIDNYGYQENTLPKIHELQGHEVEILASTETYIDNKTIGYVEPRSYKTEYGVPITRLPYTRWLPHLVSRKLRIYIGVHEFLERFEPDILFIHDLQFLSIREIARYARHRPDVRIYVDCHTDLVNSATNWISRNILHRIVYRWCARIIDPYTTKYYGVLPLRVQFLTDIYRLDPARIEFLPLGVDDTVVDLSKRDMIRHRIRERYGLTDSDFVVVCGGKIDKRKKISNLMLAVREMEETRIKLIVFGSPNDETEGEIRELSQHENIVNVGWVPADDVYDYLMAADLAVFPGTHSVLWEQAVGVGLPCVFREWAGMKHVDIGGNCVFLKTGDVAEISATILRIFEDREMYSSLQEVAMTEGVSTFSYSRIARYSIADEAETDQILSIKGEKLS